MGTVCFLLDTMMSPTMGAPMRIIIVSGVLRPLILRVKWKTVNGAIVHGALSAWARMVHVSPKEQKVLELDIHVFSHSNGTSRSSRRALGSPTWVCGVRLRSILMGR